MHSIKERNSFLFSTIFNLTSLFLFLISLLSIFYRQELPKNNFKITKLEPKTTEYFERYINFNPNIDLTKNFHLNVKQIFLYVKMINKNRIEMIWSDIIKKNDNKKIFKNLRNNYRFFEIEKNDKIVFELRGCVQPYVGLIEDQLFGRIEYTI